MPSSEVQVSRSNQGVILPIKVTPGAKRAGIRGVVDGQLKIAVTDAAEKGKANRVLLIWLSAAFELPKNRIEIVSGLTSTNKRIELLGVELAAVESRILQLIALDS